MCVCVCVCVCVRARVRARARACVHACVYVRALLVGVFVRVEGCLFFSTYGTVTFFSFSACHYSSCYFISFPFITCQSAPLSGETLQEWPADTNCNINAHRSQQQAT